MPEILIKQYFSFIKVSNREYLYLHLTIAISTLTADEEGSFLVNSPGASAAAVPALVCS